MQKSGSLVEIRHHRRCQEEMIYRGTLRGASLLYNICETKTDILWKAPQYIIGFQHCQNGPSKNPCHHEYLQSINDKFWKSLLLRQQTVCKPSTMPRRYSADTQLVFDLTHGARYINYCFSKNRSSIICAKVLNTSLWDCMFFNILGQATTLLWFSHLHEKLPVQGSQTNNEFLATADYKT